MKLCHGTSARSLAAELQHGLGPRQHMDSNWKRSPTHAEMVIASWWDYAATRCLLDGPLSRALRRSHPRHATAPASDMLTAALPALGANHGGT